MRQTGRDDGDQGGKIHVKCGHRRRRDLGIYFIPAGVPLMGMVTTAGTTGVGGTSLIGRGAFAESTAMFWASARPDSSANKQSGIRSRFSMAATPQRKCVGKQLNMINRRKADEVRASGPIAQLAGSVTAEIRHS